MFTKLFSLPQTTLLVNVLDHPVHLPDHEKVIRLLALGANPWARITTDHHHNQGKAAFEVLLARCPYYEAIDAWIGAFGDLSKSPWERRNHPSPLLLALTCVSQTDLFKENVINRLLDKGCSLRGLEEPTSWDEGRSVIELVMQKMETPVSTRVMKRLVELDKSILRTVRSRDFLADHQHLKEWGVELDAAELDAATSPAKGVRSGVRL